ncbi:MAG TPA: dipeptidase [Dehalococcoidia bacterium]|nr:dipeptidase [Dehalococcoidia bacterium]
MMDTHDLEINEEIFSDLIDLLGELVKKRSVSLDGPNTEGMRACRDLLVMTLENLGATVKLLEVEHGPDAIYAEFNDFKEDDPTVLLYAHYDVQPVGDISEWTFDPFDSTIEHGRIFGRGSSDDKSGIITHLGALQLLLSNTEALPCRIKILIEGEEELGSPHISEFLERHTELLRADGIVVADATHWDLGEPAITTSLRGVIDCEVRVKTLNLGRHSGEYGGAIPDALMALARIIGSLHNDDGSVAVQNLDSSQTNDIHVTESNLLAKAGAVSTLNLIGLGDVVSRIWTQPAISVLAIDAPTINEAVNLIVPKAAAKISMRIPPGQDPVSALLALKSHILESVPWGAQVEIVEGTISSPFKSGSSGKLMEAFQEGIQFAWGKLPREIGLGGSIPLVAEITKLFPEMDIVITGVGDPESRIHGPDESQDLLELRRNMIAEARALKAFGQL